MINKGTFEGFADWLYERRSQIVGHNGDAHDDPLAHYLSEINREKIGVSRNTVYRISSPGTTQEPQVDWQQRYTRRTEQCHLANLTGEITLILLIPGPGDDIIKGG